jgi:hypothetical protein
MADRDSEIKKLLAQDPDYASDTDITKRAKREDKMPNRTVRSAEDDYVGKRSVHDTLKSLTPREARMVQLIHGIRGAGGGGGADTREMQLGADLDPKAMMKRSGYKKGGKVKSASARADGCCIRGKTRA